MPIHTYIEKSRLLEEVRRIEKDGKNIVRFIVPELIEHRPGEMLGHVIRYAIIFDNI